MQAFSTLIIGAAACVCAAILSLTGSAAALAQSVDGPAQQVIVKWKKPQRAADQIATSARVLSDTQARYGVRMIRMRTLATAAEVIRLDRNVSRRELNDLIATLAKNPAVDYVEEDRLLQPLFTPNDSQYNEQWHYFEAEGGLNLPLAWDLSTGSGVRVAVLDTGLRPHADLATNVLGGYDFISDTFVANDGNGRDADARDPGDWRAAGACGPDSPARDSSWHGTHVSGTIAAVTNNGIGVAGVAFGARIVPVRVLGRCGGNISDIADAIIWASGGAVAGVPANPNPARVINMSLGGAGACEATAQNAINIARSRGTVVLVAAGNTSIDASGVTPANCTGVITVAAVGRNGGRASYSNFGAVVDVAAPGGDFTGGFANGVLSTLNAGLTVPAADSLAFYEGTSMATPHVAGVAALMLSRNLLLTADQVESMLRNTTRPFPAPCDQCGTGVVNAFAAANAAMAPPLAGNVDLIGLSKANTGSGSTEIHGLSGVSGFQQFIVNTGTALHPTGDTWELEVADWDRDGRPDLIGISKSNTESGSTEVHVLSGGSGFQQFIVNTGTAMHPTDDTWEFEVADWDRDGRPDLMGIKKSNTGSGSTEVHVLSQGSGFQQFILNTGTAMHPTDDTWEFEVADWDRDGRPDLIGIKKSNTGSGSTEVHVVSGSSGFQQFIVNTGTALHPTDDTWEFEVADWDQDGQPDLIGISKSNTGSGSTEVHVLSGDSGFQQFIVNTGTALHPTGNTWEFGIATWP